MAITNFSVGIEVASSNVIIGGNFLGVGVDGATPQPNLVSVYVTETADGTVIGTGRPKKRNLICGYGRYNGDKENAHEQLSILGAITNFGNNTRIQGTTVNLTRCGNDLLLVGAYVGILSKANFGTVIGGPDFCDRVVVSGHDKVNILFDSTCNDSVRNVFAGTDITGTNALGGYIGLQYIGNFVPSDTEDTAAMCAHLVQNSLFSGNTDSGVMIGHMEDTQMVSNVTLNNIKAGTDSTGTQGLPNGKHGVEIVTAINTVISDSQLNYNGKNGLYQKFGINTLVQSTETRFNEIVGTRVKTVKRPDDNYEMRLTNTRVIENVNKAIKTPCGNIATL